MAASMEATAFAYGVVGLGATGRSVLAYLTGSGARVFAADSRGDLPGVEELRSAYRDVPVRLGPFDAARLRGASTLVVSPGVDRRQPPFPELIASGVEIIGDVELFARAADAPIIAVTGSNGKSTVVSLLDAMLRASGRDVRTGGNLGTPALDLLAGTTPDLYLLELSSFQLETTFSLCPEIAVVLNVAADHMDRYDSMAAYAAAKYRIFHGARVAVLEAGQIEDRALKGAVDDACRVVTYAVESVPEHGFGVVGSVFYEDGSPIASATDLAIVGRHNEANVAAAFAVGHAFGLETTDMVRALERFEGLPHRCRPVATVAGVRFVDDSKGTNVAASAAAIAGLGGELVLIAGGVGKGADFSPLADAARGRVRHAVLIGEAAPDLARVLGPVCEVSLAKTLEEAVGRAARAATSGDTVLLSPACASFDMFEDFAHRGRSFAAAVSALVEEPRR